jgi:hypothetical protein
MGAYPEVFTSGVKATWHPVAGFHIALVCGSPIINSLPAKLTQRQFDFDLPPNLINL